MQCHETQATSWPAEISDTTQDQAASIPPPLSISAIFCRMVALGVRRGGVGELLFTYIFNPAFYRAAARCIS